MKKYLLLEQTGLDCSCICTEIILLQLEDPSNIYNRLVNINETSNLC